MVSFLLVKSNVSFPPWFYPLDESARREARHILPAMDSTSDHQGQDHHRNDLISVGDFHIFEIPGPSSTSTSTSTSRPQSSSSSAPASSSSSSLSSSSSSSSSLPPFTNLALWKKCILVKLGHTLLLFQGQIRNPYYTHSTPCSFGGVYVPMFASQCPNSGQKPCGCFLKQWTPTTPTLFVKGGTNALGPQRIEPRWELGVEQLNHLNFRRIEILHGNHWNTQNNIRNTLKFRQFTAATRKKPRASCGSRGTLVQENLVLHIFWRSNIEDFWFNNTEMVCFLWLFTIINHLFVNGLYHLFMVIWGMVCYCFTITLDQIRWLVSFMTIWGTWKWDAEIISALKILMPGWHIYIHYMILIWYNYHISIKHVYGCLWIYDINRWTYINTYIYEYLNVEMHVNIYIYMVPCPVFPPPPWVGGVWVSLLLPRLSHLPTQIMIQPNSMG